MRGKRILSVIFSIAILFTALPVKSFAMDMPLEWVVNKGNPEEETARVVIQLKKDTNKDLIKSKVNQYLGVKLKKDFNVVFNGFSADVPKSIIPLLKNMRGIEDVTESREYYPLMTSSKYLTQVLEATKNYKNKGEGMVVSIIDSGIDVSHPDMQNLTNPEKAKIKSPFVSDKNKDTKFTMKVPYGYNFADESYFVKGTESDHGMHVAGIVGANGDESKKGISGVASEVQLLAMKVFSKDEKQKGAKDDDIIAAIEASILHNADIINMSLGSVSGFMNDNDPVQRAVNAATDKGVLVVIAAGNDTAAFVDNRKTKNISNKFERQDIGVVASPSTSRKALSIASYENTHKYVHYVNFNENGQQVRNEYKITQGELKSAKNKMVYVELGYKEDFEKKKDAVKGKIALIQRGKITFTEKINNAYEYGAAGVVIFNNEDAEMPSMEITGANKNIFVTSFEKALGEKIKNLVESNPDFEIEFEKDPVKVDSDKKDDMSVFSSIGSTSNLDFKPELTGIGGNVYSTINDGKYGLSSGTSMASPHVAGASAIVLSQIKNDIKTGIDNYALFTKYTLINSAKIMTNNNFENKLPFSPRRQGAGLIQTEDAIKNRVILTNSADNEPTGALRDFVGNKEFTINAKNYGDKTLTFEVKPLKVQTTMNINKEVKEVLSSANISVDKGNITIKPGETVKINVKLNASEVSNQFVEGFINFISKDQNQPNIHFTYMGFVGNWNQEDIFDKPYNLENKNNTYYTDTQLFSTVGQGFLGKSEVVTLGIKPKLAPKDRIPDAKYVSFSPNNDNAAEVIMPQIGLLRPASSLKFSVLNSNKETVRVLGEEYNVRRQTFVDYNKAVTKGELFKTRPFFAGLWDGKVYDKKTGQLKLTDDGQYYIKVEGKLSDKYSYQTLELPVKVDTKVPKINIQKELLKEYKVLNDGREISYKVDDATGVSYTYVKIGEKRYDASYDENTKLYTVKVPFTNVSSEKAEIYAYDYAYNEAKYTINNFGDNPLQVERWNSFIDKKIKIFPSEQFSATTNLDETETMKLIFKNQKETIEKGPFKVRSKKVMFGSEFYLSPEQQGKYEAFVEEYGKENKLLRTVSLGEFIYDYVKPTITLDNAIKIDKDSKKQLDTSDPTLKRDAKLFNTYDQYKIELNPDGSVNFKGTVKDNVFSPKELKFTVNRGEEIKINDDGTFNHKFSSPSSMFDFLNLRQPGPGKIEVSKTIEGLDLAVPTNKISERKGLEKTIVISEYIKSSKEVENTEKETILSVTNRIVLNSKNLEKDATQKVEKIDGKFYFELTGNTNNSESRIFVNGNESTINSTVGGGNRFAYKVELKEGMNPVSVRVEDKEGKLLVDRKVRILFDNTLPELTLSDNTKNTIKVESETKDGKTIEKNYIETYEDFIELKGKIKDNGFGYTILVNGDHVISYRNEAAAGDTKYGNNEKEFIKQVKVEDGDVVTVTLTDSLENSYEIQYIVRKVERPVIVEEVTKNEPNDQAKIDEKLKEQAKDPKDISIKSDVDNKVEKDTSKITTKESKKDDNITKKVDDIVFEGKNLILNPLKIVVKKSDNLEDLLNDKYEISVNKNGKNVEKLDSPVKIYIPITKKNFKSLSLSRDGNVEEIKNYQIIEKDGKKYIELNTDKLSNYVLSYESEKVTSFELNDKLSINENISKNVSSNSETTEEIKVLNNTEKINSDSSNKTLEKTTEEQKNNKKSVENSKETKKEDELSDSKNTENKDNSSLLDITSIIVIILVVISLGIYLVLRKNKK
ncbi:MULTISPECIES: S8 family serine peptidase [Helcococcus]|uniref:S8 family serine peptidase n=2 Tax=Helcococcus bovis TaxID=3153252 RepID=A0ABW9F6U5_9FIRM